MKKNDNMTVLEGLARNLRMGVVICLAMGMVSCGGMWKKAGANGAGDKLAGDKLADSKKTEMLQAKAGQEQFVPGQPVDLSYAAEEAVDAVVHIKSTYLQKRRTYRDPFYELFFGRQPEVKQPEAMATGSGVILSENGYIVTNNHVIAQADVIEVVLQDKHTYPARVVGADPNTDLALLKIDASGLKYLPFGDSDKLRIGEWVLAVGNPFNLTGTVTAGIVSAKARNINILNTDMKIESFIQTDAAVNPGNSGGALVNVRGELVGINTAIASQTGSYAGYAFAVPSAIVEKVVADLQAFGHVQRALLGIRMADITSEIQRQLGLPTMDGVLIAEVIAGSAAERAGLRAGDVLTQIDGVAVSSSAMLQEQIARKSPGDQVMLMVNRGGIVIEIKAALG